MTERATVRPVTLGRLVEVTCLCEGEERATQEIEAELEISHRRARETILEAVRISLLEGDQNDNEERYRTTTVGKEFLDAIRAEDSPRVSSILAIHSPHYGRFIEVIEQNGPAGLDELLEILEAESEFTPYSYNQTGIELVGDWGERLGQVQRNAFTGTYYLVETRSVPDNFPYVLLRAYDELEENAGVNLRQRYLSIPRLREALCQRLAAPRTVVDEALLLLCQQNVGKLELSGAPIDTGAKDSVLSIKRIELVDDDTLVSTSQSSQRVMAGIEQFGKKYYYLAVHDRDITFSPEANA